jgi:hypothetical protein
MTTKNIPTISNVVGEDEENENEDVDGEGVGGVFIQKGGEGDVSGDGLGDGDGDGLGLGLGEGDVLDDVYVSRTVSSYIRICVLPQSHGSTSPLLEVSTSSFIYYTKRFYYCVKVCTNFPRV